MHMSHLFGILYDRWVVYNNGIIDVFERSGSDVEPASNEENSKNPGSDSKNSENVPVRSNSS